MVTALDREISTDSLGITLPHEHLTIDLSAVKDDPDAKINQDQLVSSLEEVKQQGVETVVDVTNIGMGRNIRKIKKMRDRLNINVIASTGFYKEPFLPNWVGEKSVDQLAQLMIKELTEGIGKSDLCAGIIGEIGTGSEITKSEKKIFTAAAAAHNYTQVPILTHLTLGSLGLEQIELLASQGVDLSKVVLSHVSLSDDLEYIMELAKAGVFLGLDTIGKIKYQSEQFRVDLIKELFAAGYSDQILLSLDITRNSHLNSYGYKYLFEEFIPKLKQVGLKDKQIEQLLIANPKRLFSRGE